ncbi:hypothetical protein SNE40_013557 [Patella caerulea]|uniref:Uncharacterized protein n=1 Tax=Patella caerulea TaxID=87958 RepID=A0AAN8JDQ2_PATCE
MIENSGDDDRDIIPFIKPVLLKRWAGGVDDFEYLDSDEEDLIEDEIMRDPIVSDIDYVKKIIKSNTTKTGRETATEFITCISIVEFVPKTGRETATEFITCTSVLYILVFFPKT